MRNDVRLPTGGVYRFLANNQCNAAANKAAHAATVE